MTSFFTRLFILACLATFSSQVLAQAAFETALAKQIEAIRALPDTADYTPSFQAFDRIAAANPKAWLAQYYSAHFNLIQHWNAKDGCEPCVERADAALIKAEAIEPNNAEVMTMRARYYQAMIGLHPMRTPFYGPKATELLQTASAVDPKNPRAAATLGANLLYTPSMFGGGAEAAIPHLERAEKLYAAEVAQADRAKHLPTWGAGENAATLAKARKS